MSMLKAVRESNAEFGMMVGTGTDEDPDVIVDVQIAATGKAAASLTAAVRAWHEEWMEAQDAS